MRSRSNYYDDSDEPGWGIDDLLDLLEMIPLVKAFKIMGAVMGAGAWFITVPLILVFLGYSWFGASYPIASLVLICYVLISLCSVPYVWYGLMNGPDFNSKASDNTNDTIFSLLARAELNSPFIPRAVFASWSLAGYAALNFAHIFVSRIVDAISGELNGLEKVLGSFFCNSILVTGSAILMTSAWAMFRNEAHLLRRVWWASLLCSSILAWFFGQTPMLNWLD